MISFEPNTDVKYQRICLFITNLHNVDVSFVVLG